MAQEQKIEHDDGGLRLIDKENRVRKKPMRVLVLGYSRTATWSMREALVKLGYTPYHFVDNFSNPANFGFWTEAMQNKYFGQGRPYTPRDIDKILNDYDAVLDLPHVMFVEELLEAFPDAKVVLTLRDPEKWVQSMRKTILRKEDWSWEFLRPFSSLIDGMCGTLEVMWKILCPGSAGMLKCSPEFGALLKKNFMEHYGHVREVVPKKKLLEHKPQDGWEPLCKFLGKETPSEPYPNLNDADTFMRRITLIWWANTVKAAVTTAMPFAVAAGAWMWATGRLPWFRK